VAGNPYAITASGAASSDYTISYADGELTVTPAPLTITADDKSKVYGAPLPALTASYSGFVNGDDPTDLITLPTLSTPATASSHVADSPYPITAAGAASSDYTISYVAGLLQITPVPLTITADDKTKLQGDPVPPLTVTYAGFVNGDDEADLITPPNLSTTATAASDPGTYPIFVSGATSSDYAISHANGTLTVVSSQQNAAFLAPDPLDPTKTNLFVYGTDSHDQILFSRGQTAADVTVRINGVVKGTFRPTSSIVAHGLAGNDLISVANNVTRRAWLYGEDGIDVLLSGGGPSILLGGNGNDSLTSGNGRALLIGGAASDLLTSGSGAAVMIGGSTDYDANDEALLAVLNEWSSNGTYTNRVNHITGQSGGVNGPYFLNQDSIDIDGVPDVYLSINSRDLIFKSIGDVLTGQSAGEVIIVV
jgi:Ca2+-binding RTX toxin-like protein